MKLASLIAAFLLILSSISYADEAESPGVTPDSPLYGLDVAFDNIRLSIEFRQDKKAELALKYAEERLEELKRMSEEDKRNGYEKAKEQHERMLERFEESSKGLSPEAYAKIEARFDDFSFRFDDAYDEESNSSYSDDFEDLREGILEKREKLQERRESIRERLEESNLTEEEIEEILAQKEEQFQNKSQERIAQAEGCLEREVNVTEDREDHFILLRGVSQAHLNASLAAYDNGKYGRAYGQATSSWQICRASERYASGVSLEKIKREFENSENQTHAKIELKVKCDGEKTEVEAKIETSTGKEEVEFELEGCASREEIISELKERTSLTDEELNIYLGSSLQTRQKFEFRLEQNGMMDDFRREYELKIRDDRKRFEERMRLEFRNRSGEDGFEDGFEEEQEIEDENEETEDEESEDSDRSGSNSGSG